MSWVTFKQNIVRLSENPQAIGDIDLVAKTYAEEYDACIKRGMDVISMASVKKGNVEMMKTLFKFALQQGQLSTVAYDLVGAMGGGVIAYWSSAALNEFPIPIIPAKILYLDAIIIIIINNNFSNIFLLNINPILNKYIF